VGLPALSRARRTSLRRRGASRSLAASSRSRSSCLLLARDPGRRGLRGARCSACSSDGRRDARSTCRRRSPLAALGVGGGDGPPVHASGGAGPRGQRRRARVPSRRRAAGGHLRPAAPASSRSHQGTPCASSASSRPRILASLLVNLTWGPCSSASRGGWSRLARPVCSGSPGIALRAASSSSRASPSSRDAAFPRARARGQSELLPGGSTRCGPCRRGPLTHGLLPARNTLLGLSIPRSGRPRGEGG
jgi:hypothetical protein